MIRRAIVVLVMSAATVIGSASVADAGELCIRLLPTKANAQFCVPTH